MRALFLLGYDRLVFFSAFIQLRFFFPFRNEEGREHPERQTCTKMDSIEATEEQ